MFNHFNAPPCIFAEMVAYSKCLNSLNATSPAFIIV